MGAAQPPTAELPSLSPSPGVPGADGEGTLPGGTGTGCCVPSSPLGVSLSGQAPQPGSFQSPYSHLPAWAGLQGSAVSTGASYKPCFPLCLGPGLRTFPAQECFPAPSAVFCPVPPAPPLTYSWTGSQPHCQTDRRLSPWPPPPSFPWAPLLQPSGHLVFPGARLRDPALAQLAGYWHPARPLPPQATLATVVTRP